MSALETILNAHGVDMYGALRAIEESKTLDKVLPSGDIQVLADWICSMELPNSIMSVWTLVARGNANNTVNLHRAVSSGGVNVGGYIADIVS